MMEEEEKNRQSTKKVFLLCSGLGGLAKVAVKFAVPSVCLVGSVTCQQGVGGRDASPWGWISRPPTNKRQEFSSRTGSI